MLKKNDTVLLIAPSYAITYINELFITLQLKIIIYDIIDYDIDLPINITYYKEEFTDETAYKYKNKIDLFMSDVRIKYDKKIKHDRFNKFMEGQKKWIEIMKPKISLIKILLPYWLDTYNYLKGTIHFQLWSNGSQESILIVNINENNEYNYKDYNTKDYENKYMAFYDARIDKYNCPLINKIKFFDNCYDCAFEYHLWKKYCEKYGNKNNIVEYVETTTKILNKFHNTHRTMEHNKY